MQCSKLINVLHVLINAIFELVNHKVLGEMKMLNQKCLPALRRLNSYQWIVSLIAILWISSCTDRMVHYDSIVPINPYDAKEEINLSFFATDVEIVQLRLPADQMFARVLKIMIREKYIYTVDMMLHVMNVFDRDGHHVAQLKGQGKGPGEYLRIGPVFVDEDERYVEVLTYSGTGFGLLRYSNIDFVFQDFTPVPEVFVDSGVKNNGNYYLGNHQSVNFIDGRENSASLFAICKDSLLLPFLDYERNTDGHFFSVHADNFVVDSSGDLLFSRMYDNVVYKIEECSIKPWMEIDFGKYGIDNAVQSLPGREQISYLRGNAGLASFPFLKAQGHGIQLFSYLFKEEANVDSPLFQAGDRRHYIRLTEMGEALHAKKIKNDFSLFPEYIFNGPEYRGVAYNVMQGEYLVDVLFPGNEQRVVLEQNAPELWRDTLEDYDPNSILLVFISLNSSNEN